MAPKKTSKTEVITDVTAVASGFLSAKRLVTLLISLFKSTR